MAAVGDRVLALFKPQQLAYPCLTLQRVATEPSHNLAGTVSLVAERWQVDAWADALATVDALAWAVFRQLQGLKAVVGKTSFQGCRWIDRADEYDDPSQKYRSRQDFMIEHRVGSYHHDG